MSASNLHALSVEQLCVPLKNFIAAIYGLHKSKISMPVRLAMARVN
jgi:hypothetical protein